MENRIRLTPVILEKNIPFNRNWDATERNPEGSVTEYRLDTPKSFIFVFDHRNNLNRKGFVLEITGRGRYDESLKLGIEYVDQLVGALRLFGETELADNFKI